MDDQRSVEAARYCRFADHEASGRSPLYEECALGVAGDAEVLAFLLTLPAAKRQPNLLFAAVRHLIGTAENWAAFWAGLLDNRQAVRAEMLQRSTQTNEPARCATLLPVLARLPQPLALIEVGASAGLCLLPDFYAYDYGAGVVRPDRAGGVPPGQAGGVPPVFGCFVSGAAPVPDRVPEIVWRAGLDLNPLDVSDPSHAGWLETLVWPEQTGRLANLRAAMAIAAAVKPMVVQGDLLGEALPGLCRQAPDGATLVIFHTAVLAYVAASAERQAFARSVRSLCRYWISNESHRVFTEHAGMTGAAGRFLMSVNGSPVAWTDPHGAALEWIGGTNEPWAA